VMFFCISSSDGSSGVVMKDKATYAGIYFTTHMLLFTLMMIFEREDFTLRPLRLQRFTRTTASSEEVEDYAAAPTPVALGGNGCWVFSSSPCSCLDSCLASLHWVRLTFTKCPLKIRP